MGATILYISFDGVLQPLAFSQVVRLVTRLAAAGFSYHLLSVERSRDLADAVHVTRVRKVLADAGVEWTTVGVDLAGSIRRSAQAFALTTAQATRIVLSRRVRLLHARGYQAALVAQSLRRSLNLPYLFDARGCWIDERQDWFARSTSYALGKLVERQLYRDAAAVVTLTELHGTDVIDGAFGRKDPSMVRVVPTCADYDEFRLSNCRPDRPVDSSAVPMAVQRRLHRKLVLAIVGSANRSYLTAAALRFAQSAYRVRDDAHLLVLTQQDATLRTILSHSELPPQAYTIATSRHHEMPEWLQWIDWGLLLLPDVAAKRGSMPTKLAEFFASGVRPIAFGCNAEMISWVRRAGSGIVLDSCDDVALEAAARAVSSTPPVDELHFARMITAPHFSLATGVARYAALMTRLGV